MNKSGGASAPLFLFEYGRSDPMGLGGGKKKVEPVLYYQFFFCILISVGC
jgi:hypothetical protein